MKIYHTCSSRADVATAREHAPSHEHGFGWIPEKMCRFDAPYFLDNGCYKASLDDETIWWPGPFFDRLEQLSDMPRMPDFVTLPDVPGASDGSVERSGRWLKSVRVYDAPMYLPVQDGACARQEVRRATRWGCTGVFLGGSDAHKREIVRDLVRRAHDADLNVHVGKPGSLLWAHDVGVDSVDTSSIVRHNAWHRLDALEAADDSRQATLTAH